MPTQQQIDSTTQKFLDIHDITNNLVILKDGTTSLVITVDAMNFGLLAEEEQDSIMYAYAGLLNSLNYPIQILVKSQTKDVTGYLRLLKEQEDVTLNNIQRQRIMKYREFVSNLIRERNVLDKKFYVAIPARPLELGLVPVSSVVPGQAQTDISTVDKSMVIEKARSILEPKRDHLIAQFARIGLYSRQLETQEIIQLFYQSYNPEAFEGQTMGDSKTYTAPLVSASIEETNMDTQNNPPQPMAPTAPVSNTAQAVPAPQMQAPVAETSATETQPMAQTMAPSAMAQPNPTETTPTMPDMIANSSAGYTPTIMNNSGSSAPQMQAPVAETSATETQPMAPTMAPSAMAQPNQAETVPTMPDMTTPRPSTSTPEPTVETPMPPAPELPKTIPGQVDASVPQEVEIKIEHPSEKGTEVPAETTTTNPQSPTIEETPSTTTNSGTPMPPLPEIK